MSSHWTMNRWARLGLAATLATGLAACETSDGSCDGGPCPEDGAVGEGADMSLGGSPEGGAGGEPLGGEPVGGEHMGGAGGGPMGGNPEGGAGGDPMGGAGGEPMGGTVGGAGGEPSGDQPITVRVGGTEVADGDGYFHPLNGGNARTPLFSFYTDVYTIENTSDAPVHIDDVRIEHPEGIEAEEFTLRNCLTEDEAQVIEDEMLPPGGTLNFDMCFYAVAGDLPPFEGELYACEEDRDCGCFADDDDCPPIRYRGEYCLQGLCQAPRQADVVIQYDGGDEYRFTAAGRARPRATTMFSHGRSEWEIALGGYATDELMTGMVTDTAGNAFFAGNVAQVINIFAHDILIGKVAPDGSLAWLKAWSGKFQDYSRDPGQNGETGGGAGALAVDEDGDVYLVGAHSATSSNSLFWSLIVKLDGQTGEPVWQKVWGNTSGPRIARDGSEAYAVDISGDHVLVTGVNEDNAKVLFLSLDRRTGAVVAQRSVEVAAGSNDRGYAIKADGQGGAYIGGLTNGRGLLMHLEGVETARPRLSWTRRINMGTGSNINHIDVDTDGNAYLSLDRRGANTAFSVMRVGRDGAFHWSRSFNPAGGGDKDNTHVVRVIDDYVYIGGRVGVGQYDAQFGDGLLVRAHKDTGALAWATFYYSGKGAEEMAEHRVKGIAVGPEGDLIVAGQAYTNPNNHFRYHGYWYDATRKDGDAEDDRPFDWVPYCPEGDAACDHGRPERPDCLPDYECTFIYEPIPEASMVATGDNRGVLDATEAAAQDRNFQMVPSYNGFFDLTDGEVPRVEGSVGAPCEGGPSCGVQCHTLDEGACEAGDNSEVCASVRDGNTFERCRYRRGAVVHSTLAEDEGNGPDGELFLMRLSLD